MNEAIASAIERDRLRTGQVTELTGIPRSTLQRWATGGRIKATRMPSGKWTFRYADIEHLIPADAR